MPSTNENCRISALRLGSETSSAISSTDNNSVSPESIGRTLPDTSSAFLEDSSCVGTVGIAPFFHQSECSAMLADAVPFFVKEAECVSVASITGPGLLETLVPQPALPVESAPSTYAHSSCSSKNSFKYSDFPGSSSTISASVLDAAKASAPKRGHYNGNRVSQDCWDAQCLATPNPVRLHVRDRYSDSDFLIDTGAAASLIPPTKAERKWSMEFELLMADGSPLQTYGMKTLQLDIGLQRDFEWIFIVGDVTGAIIGGDFLAHFNLVPDIARQILEDRSTGLSVQCSLTADDEAQPLPPPPQKPAKSTKKRDSGEKPEPATLPPSAPPASCEKGQPKKPTSQSQKPPLPSSSGTSGTAAKPSSLWGKKPSSGTPKKVVAKPPVSAKHNQGRGGRLVKALREAGASWADFEAGRYKVVETRSADGKPMLVALPAQNVGAPPPQPMPVQPQMPSTYFPPFGWPIPGPFQPLPRMAAPLGVPQPVVPGLSQDQLVALITGVLRAVAPTQYPQ